MTESEHGPAESERVSVGAGRRSETAKPGEPIFPLSVTLAIVFASYIVVAAVAVIARAVVPVEAPLDVRYAIVIGAGNLALIAGALTRLGWIAVDAESSRSRSWAVKLHVLVLFASTVLVVIAMVMPTDVVLASLNTAVLVLLTGHAVWLIRSGAVRAVQGRRRYVQGLVGAGVLLFVGWLWATQLFFVGHAQIGVALPRLIQRPFAPPANEQPLTLTTIDQVPLVGGYLAGDPGMPGVVLCHGLAANRGQLKRWAVALNERGYHVISFDFRAHGRSGGTVCSIVGREVLDIDAAVAWLNAQPGVDTNNLFLIGNSMGGGVTLAAAPRLRPEPLRAIVCFAPASDLEMVADWRLRIVGPLAGPTKWIGGLFGHAIGDLPLQELSPNRDLDRAAGVPVLVFHGRDDTTVPPALTEALEARHPDSVEVVWIDDMTHRPLSDHVFAVSETREQVFAFLERYRVGSDDDSSDSSE